MSDKGESGRAVLAEVMGQAYVDARQASITDFNRPLRTFIDENCFGDVWTRPGLERKTRSLILISTLIALNRPTQVEAHVQSAINNGATVGEIQEVLYQTIAYCGLPAAADGFRVAEAVLRKMGKL
ncbi:carboxymuconolactone decarboxylase family protein [Sphingobium baderi]|uniref:4-carboxymuconolactone decarboxylase n=1 Tax=Sphingobium baderi TaxID=1332080 RepID=A0A0S3EY86_9SPHN|nr:carboxymuconolactone decarboxylase family protein [Sphingobium baderi]ALR20392.1 4-carboxymuconolactone decarboxylase [Sphingobium baderi]